MEEAFLECYLALTKASSQITLVEADLVTPLLERDDEVFGVALDIARRLGAISGVLNKATRNSFDAWADLIEARQAREDERRVG